MVSNAINNSGRRAPLGSGIADFVAAIKMSGCRHTLVASNNITATDPGDYNGFGILSCDSKRDARANFVNGNAVSAPYNAAIWNGQSRYVNLVSGDKLGLNYTSTDRG